MVGKRIAHYEITEKLGEGGMGVVYKARDTHLDRFVAIKILPPEKVADPTRKRRFVREAKTASALNHPHIVTIHDIDQSDGVDFIAMEYIAGRTLADLIPRNGFDFDKAVHYALQVADALAAAHEAGILHRDLKPANIMVSDRGLVKVLDFGLAKLAELPGDSTLTLETAPDTIVGTPAYMSPEQVERRKLDHRSDVFSFGVVFYQMLTGRRAFQRDSIVATMAAILREEPPMDDISPRLSAVIRCCLEKDPRQRYPHTIELKEALEALEQPTPEAASPSIAILPFANLSPDPENEYFSDGLAEEIINALTKVAGLRVTARTSSFAFRGRNLDVREVGAKLNVGHILEGSVRKAGDRLRITAQLINAADGYHLWSERYDRRMADIFDIQDEISRAIVDKLRVQLVGDSQAPLVKRYTDNMEAYDLFLRGRLHYYRFTPSERRLAVQYFEQAKQLDPQYALPYVGIGGNDIIDAILGIVRPRETLEKAEAELNRAMEIDAGVALAHSYFGWVRDYQWDRDGAEAAHLRAIALDPGDSYIHYRFGQHLIYWGRTEEAISAAKKAVDLDPVSPTVRFGLADCYNNTYEYHQAEEQARMAMELEPRNFLGHLALSVALWGQERREEAIQSIESSRAVGGGSSLVNGLLAFYYAGAGRREEAEALLRELLQCRKDDYFSAAAIAWAYFGLGDNDTALEWLETAYQDRDPLLLFTMTGPVADFSRSSDPRFQDLRKRMNFRE